jgi:Glycosyl transferase family 2
MLLARCHPTSAPVQARTLLGASVDLPAPGSVFNINAVPVQGWAARHNGDRVRIALTVGGQTLRVLRPSVERPDVLQQFAGDRIPLRCGFETTLDLERFGRCCLQVDAIEGKRRSPIGAVLVVPEWRRSGHPAERNVVSVIIACCNQAHFLAEAIESALGQTHRPVEVVVVDDGSTDNTQEVAQRYPEVRYIRQNNQGLSAARNTGIRRSNGEFLIFLDADDRLRPNAAEAGLGALAANPAAAFASGEHCHLGLDGVARRVRSRAPLTGEHYAHLLEGNYVGCPAAVTYRRPAVAAAGGFDARFTPCEDYELYLRLARRYPVVEHGATVAEYRRYGAAMSDDRWRMLAVSLAVHDREKRHLRGRQDLQRAFETGRRFWIREYGAPLAQDILGRLNTPGKRVGAIRDAARLARLCPAALTTIRRRPSQR